MGRLAKLVSNPILFLRDFLDKRLGDASTNVNNLIIRGGSDDKSYHFFYCCGESLSSGEHHLNSWLPIFNDYALTHNIHYVLVLRNKRLFDWVITKYPQITVAYAKRAVDIEAVLKKYPDIRLALYSSASISNGHLIRFNHIKHAFIGHGDSEKAGSAHKGLRWFDEIWTAGQAHIDRFNNLEGVSFRGLDFIKVGRPGLKKLIVDNQEYIPPIIQEYNIRILYLPTWEGVFEAHQYFSIPISQTLIESIIFNLKCNLDVKFHPYTGGRNPNYKKIMSQVTASFVNNENFKCIKSDQNIVDIIQHYDLFICDISSVVTECLSLDRPIFLYQPKDRSVDMATSNMRYEEYCYVFSSVEELTQKLNRVLHGDDYLQQGRSKALDYFIGVEETKKDKLLQLIRCNS